MAEYIERKAIQKRLNRIVEVNNLRTDLAWFTPYGVNALIEEIPAADVRPVVRGKWKIQGGGFVKCTACMMLSFNADTPETWNYCPNCGAIMEEN